MSTSSLRAWVGSRAAIHWARDEATIMDLQCLSGWTTVHPAHCWLCDHCRSIQQPLGRHFTGFFGGRVLPTFARNDAKDSWNSWNFWVFQCCGFCRSNSEFLCLHSILLTVIFLIVRNFLCVLCSQNGLTECSTYIKQTFLLVLACAHILLWVVTTCLVQPSQPLEFESHIRCPGFLLRPVSPDKWNPCQGWDQFLALGSLFIVLELLPLAVALCLLVSGGVLSREKRLSPRQESLLTPSQDTAQGWGALPSPAPAPSWPS